MSESLRINFVLPASDRITGGPLAILEYANRLHDRGHTVSITTFPNWMWAGENPFPWFKVKGEVRYLHENYARGGRHDRRILDDLQRLLLISDPIHKTPFDFLLRDSVSWLRLMEAMPECDLNVATYWSTAFPVYFSHKGKPVYFMQHFEEVFYTLDPETLLHRMLARMSYALPMYKVANSSWLQKLILETCGQAVPFSNNGLDLADFHAERKLSEEDGIVRVVTYARPEQWKGFGDAAAAMEKVIAKYGDKVEWHVFGYLTPDLPEDNAYAPYTYHPKLPFKELARLYATSDIVLCPSWYESFPLPPLEGMASGTAVITTAYGTEDYAFEGKNALVVGSRDTDAMANAISRLIDCPDLRCRLAEEGLKTAARYGWDQAVERREQILLDIHHGTHGYDVLGALRMHAKDAAGIDFDRSPVATDHRPLLFWKDDSLFLLYDGLMRNVTRTELIPELLRRGVTYGEADALTVARTPMGGPLVSVADLPHF